MSDNNTLAKQIELVRKETIAVLEELQQQARSPELPELPAILDAYRRKLIENVYQVPVVGAVKRGKSSFINALIGRDILPTDPEVATRQVFRIQNADHEAYRLRLEDGSTHSITLADLPKFGSQVFADEAEIPDLDRFIRWIEVDIPTTFLPQGISLLDTPGMGGLYSAHAEITQRFVPDADAVIFVLDSSPPITEKEVKFLERIWDVTHNIFFIQTKIDKFSKKAWNETLKRSEEILKDKLKDYPTDIHLWPISNSNLMKAAKTGDNDYLYVSQYEELALALKMFLYQVAGWNHAKQTIHVAQEYVTHVLQLLATRMYRLRDEKQRDLYQRLTQRKAQFETEWGIYSHKRHKLISDIYSCVAKSKQSMSQAIQPGGKIEKRIREKIAKLSSIEDIKEYSKLLASDVVVDTLDEWRQISHKLENDSLALLGPFLDASESLNIPIEVNPPDPTLESSNPANVNVQDNWLRLLTLAGKELIAVWTTGSTVLFGYVGIAAIIAVLWATARIVLFHKKGRVILAKDQLNQELERILQEVREQLGESSVTHTNRIDEHFDFVAETLSTLIQNVVVKKSQEVQAQLDLMDDDARLSENERFVKATALQKQIGVWEDIDRSIKHIDARLNSLDQRLKIPLVPDL